MPLPLTATQPPLVSRRLDGILDWARMLSGAGLVVFLWGHLVLVGGIIIGPDVMNAAARFFTQAYLVQVGGPLVFALFLAHVVLAVRTLPLRPEGQKTFWRHARMLHHADTWSWLVQAATGAGILVLGGLHMWTVLADQPVAALTSAARVRGGGWLAPYLLLLPLTEVHAGIGVYRIAVKWGFLKRADRLRFKHRRDVLVLVFVAVGLAALTRFWFLAA